MNKIRRSALVVVVALFFMINVISVNAADTKLFTLYDCADNLRSQGIADIVKDDFNSQLTRKEAIDCIVNMIIDKDEAFLKVMDSDFIGIEEYDKSCTAYLIALGDIEANEEDKPLCDEYISYKECAILLMRILGYDSTLEDYTYENVTDIFKNTVSLDPKTIYELEEETFLKKHFIKIVHQTLVTPVKNSSKTLIEYLLFKGLGDVDKAVENRLIDKNSVINTKTTKKILTSNYDKAFVSFTCVDDKVMIDGKIEDKSRPFIWFQVDNKKRKVDKVLEAKKDNKIHSNMAHNLIEGTNTVSIYRGKKRYGTYYKWLNDVTIEKKGKEYTIFLPREDILKNNIDKYYFTKFDIDIKRLLEPSKTIQSDDPKIIKLSNDITKDCKTDYEKIKAIHDWVAGNIYYDMDVLNTGNFEKTDALGTLEDKRSVCQGYASLMTALIRAAKIPCAMVHGYAIGITKKGGWTDTSLTDTSNHAWNEVYLDGRWIIIDATWDSFNKYEKGKFTDGNMIYNTYFDITLEQFSNTHRIDLQYY